MGLGQAIDAAGQMVDVYQHHHDEQFSSTDWVTSITLALCSAQTQLTNARMPTVSCPTTVMIARIFASSLSFLMSFGSKNDL